jgi:hypothetical protein
MNLSLPNKVLYFILVLAISVVLYFGVKGMPEYLDNVSSDQVYSPESGDSLPSGVGSSVPSGIGSSIEGYNVSPTGADFSGGDFSGSSAPQGASGDIVPMDLLPNNNAAAVFAEQNPMGEGISQGQNFLTAGFNIGVDTRGGSMKNPTLDIRPEPLIPKVDVGPWNQSTYEPDMYRQNVFSQ